MYEYDKRQDRNYNESDCDTDNNFLKLLIAYRKMRQTNYSNQESQDEKHKQRNHVNDNSIVLMLGEVDLMAS
jgi:hypothetical protein